MKLLISQFLISKIDCMVCCHIDHIVLVNNCNQLQHPRFCQRCLHIEDTVPLLSPNNPTHRNIHSFVFSLLTYCTIKLNQILFEFLNAADMITPISKQIKQITIITDILNSICFLLTLLRNDFHNIFKRSEIIWIFILNPNKIVPLIVTDIPHRFFVHLFSPYSLIVQLNFFIS